MYKFTDMLKNHQPTAENYPSRVDDTAVLIYTGGTTGVSKGVEPTHRNLASNCQRARAWCVEFVDGQEIVLGGLPFFPFIWADSSMIVSVFYGWCNVLIPKPEARPYSRL